MSKKSFAILNRDEKPGEVVVVKPSKCLPARGPRIDTWLQRATKNGFEVLDSTAVGFSEVCASLRVGVLANLT
jgi:hypothetical protein